MTTIVRHRRTGNEYILLGINGEVGKANPSRFISELFAPDRSEVSCSVTVCDIRGNIFLASIDDLVVTEIDGKKLTDILPEPTFEQVNNNVYQDIYQQQTDDFDDDESLAEENLIEEKSASLENLAEGNTDDSENLVSESNQSLSSSSYSQKPPEQDEFADDDEDWI